MLDFTIMTKEIQVITATSEPAEEATEIGSENFVKKLLNEFHAKHVWRRLESLALALSVDVQHLRQWLDSAPGIARKLGKEDGVFLYCWEKRLTETPEDKEKPKKEKKINQRPSIREEDRYALGILHMIYWNLYKALKTYGLEINQIDAESFNNLAVALDKLESGLVLFSNKTGATMEKLPKFS
jgi:hypothetical protein